MRIVTSFLVLKEQLSQNDEMHVRCAETKDLTQTSLYSVIAAQRDCLATQGRSLMQCPGSIYSTNIKCPVLAAHTVEPLWHATDHRDPTERLRMGTRLGPGYTSLVPRPFPSGN